MWIETEQHHRIESGDRESDSEVSKNNLARRVGYSKYTYNKSVITAMHCCCWYSTSFLDKCANINYNVSYVHVPRPPSSPHFSKVMGTCPVPQFQWWDMKLCINPQCGEEEESSDQFLQKCYVNMLVLPTWKHTSWNLTNWVTWNEQLFYSLQEPQRDFYNVLVILGIHSGPN